MVYTDYVNKLQIKGVNIGGWLVLERWLTPSVFEGSEAKDEYTLSRTAEGRKRIKAHRKEFITEKDIKWLANNGIEAVRIPVGYWLYDKNSEYVSGDQELKKCLEWCDKYQIKVLICLHGAQGSQNGHNHSGRIGKIGLWRDGNRQRAIETLEEITCRYRAHKSFWGIEMLNEPYLGRNYWRVLWFYRRAYSRIRTAYGSDRLKIVFSDGYRPRLMSATLFFRKNVMMDIHQYHMLTMINAFSRRHLSWYKWRLRRRRRLYRWLANFQPIIIGEWTAVMGYELLQNEKIKESDFWQTHADLQMRAFSSAEATFYWTYKTEGNNAWNLKYMLDSGKLMIQ